MKAKDKVKMTSFPSTNPFTTKWSGVPPNETEEEAQVRVKLMQEAVRVSKEIDQSLNEARKAIEKKKKAVKILLLGMLLRSRLDAVDASWLDFKDNQSPERYATDAQR